MAGTRIITTLLCSLVGFNAMLMASEHQPKLVVTIVVDQLRTDYLELLQGRLGADGFKRLMQNGAYFKDVDFEVDATDRAVGTVMLMTGAYPYLSGITDARAYDHKLRQGTPALLSSGGYSPEALQISTVSDELVIASDGLSAVYSVAVEPQMAVLMAGHSGNAAAWIDDNSGRWTASSWYKDGTPQPLSTRNHRLAPALTIDTMSWRPLYSKESYVGIPEQKRAYPFMHTFSRSDRDVYRRFLTSPLANREVTDLAIEYLAGLNLGRRTSGPDLLAIGYTLSPYRYVTSGSDERFELQDAYLRLDLQLERLFAEIEKTVGLDNTLVFLASTGYYSPVASSDREKYRIPGGDLSLKRVAALLNAYLAAKYGNGNYIDDIMDHDLWFDLATIEAHGLSIEDVARTSRDFISQMSGVAEAYTLSDILDQQTPEMRARRLSTDATRAGHLWLDYQPGWTVINDMGTNRPMLDIRHSAVMTPAFIMGADAEAKIYEEPVKARRLAPTISGLLHIRSPNAATQKPLF